MQTLSPRPCQQNETPAPTTRFLAPAKRHEFFDEHDIDNPLVLEFRGVFDAPRRPL
jgi:hypothetical protein